MSTAARTLYEIRDDLDALAALLAEVGGDVSEEEADAAITAWLTETDEAMKDKLDRYAALIQEIDARAVARTIESKRLAQLAEVDQNTVKRLKGRVLAFLQAQEIEKVETPRFRLTVAQNGGSVPVRLLTDPIGLPPQFRDEVVSYHARTTDLRNALMRGDEHALGYAVLGERGHHLRIK